MLEKGIRNVRLLGTWIVLENGDTQCRITSGQYVESYILNAYILYTTNSIYTIYYILYILLNAYILYNTYEDEIVQ